MSITRLHIWHTTEIKISFITVLVYKTWPLPSGPSKNVFMMLVTLRGFSPFLLSAQLLKYMTCFKYLQLLTFLFHLRKWLDSEGAG